jgi:hypothetical protein
MGHARSMRDHWEPCHEWFLGASLGFRGLREAAGAANGQGRLWEAVRGCREPQGVARGLRGKTGITGHYLLALGAQLSQ